MKLIYTKFQSKIQRLQNLSNHFATLAIHSIFNKTNYDSLHSKFMKIFCHTHHTECVFNASLTSGVHACQPGVDAEGVRHRELLVLHGDDTVQQPLIVVPHVEVQEEEADDGGHQDDEEMTSVGPTDRRHERGGRGV